MNEDNAILLSQVAKNLIICQKSIIKHIIKISIYSLFQHDNTDFRSKFARYKIRKKIEKIEDLKLSEGNHIKTSYSAKIKR